MKSVKTVKLIIALENFPLYSIGMLCASLSDYINNVYLYIRRLYLSVLSIWYNTARRDSPDIAIYSRVYTAGGQVPRQP